MLTAWLERLSSFNAAWIDRLSNAHALPYFGTGGLTLGAIDIWASSGSIGGWLLVIVGLTANLLYIFPRRATERAKQREAEARAQIAEDEAIQEQYDALERRASLCARCKAEKWGLTSCVVPDVHRPADCPLKKPTVKGSLTVHTTTAK